MRDHRDHNQATPGGERRPRARIKRYLPKTLFGRALLIIITPALLVQSISIFVFFDRHLDTVTRRLAEAVSGDVAMVVDQMIPAPTSSEEIADIRRRAQTLLRMTVSYEPGRVLAAPTPEQFGRAHDSVEAQLARTMAARVRRPATITAMPEHRRVVIAVQIPDGLLTFALNEKRVYSSTPHIFLMWMIGSSLVFFAIAIIFMRNQIRPIDQLATAARAFGMGREVGTFRPAGASEVRQAGQAFQQMRNRLNRQRTQRTEMLAGVSHDLRTPLTRMKLQLAMLEETEETGETGEAGEPEKTQAAIAETITDLKSDVGDMERMIEAYLAFARGEGTEVPVKTNMAALVEAVVEAENRHGTAVDLIISGEREAVIELRPEALRRALANLITNARRYGEAVQVTLEIDPDQAILTVDDDGPGVPPESRGDVVKPFFRLDPSRSRETGGAGLGLTIARDIARSHGGDLSLDTAPGGGLRATITVPR